MIIYHPPSRANSVMVHRRTPAVDNKYRDAGIACPAREVGRGKASYRHPLMPINANRVLFSFRSMIYDWDIRSGSAVVASNSGE
ncbi:MAG: hypothetical protein ABI478_14430 [Propionivibrio sp.]